MKPRKRHHARAAALLICLLQAASLTAQTADNGDRAQTFGAAQQAADSSLAAFPQARQSAELQVVFWKSIGIILAFSAALYAGLKLIRKVGGGKGLGGRSDAIRVVGTTTIGYKKTLCIVRVCDHHLVLGVAENDISLLLDLPDEEISDAARNTLSHDGARSEPRFKDVLKRLTSS